MALQAYLYDADGSDREVKLDESLVAHLTERQLLWVDVLGVERDDLEQVASLLKLHRESVRTVLNPVGRPRLDHYGSYFQINVVALNEEGKETSNYKPISLDFFSGPNYVVTVHNEEVTYLREFRERDKGDSQLGELSSEAFVAALLDWHLATYFRVLENLETQVDRLDEEVLGRDASRDYLAKLVGLRRRVSRLHRLLAPHRDVFYALSRPDFTPIADSESAAHFRTLNDRFERAVDAIENARDLVLGSFELFATRTSQTTNDVMRILTVVTLAVGTMGVIAGVMGMNFELSFFKAGPVGFWEVVGGMVLILSSTLVFAKFKHWL